MVKVAVERKLRQLEPEVGNHHTRVDAGHIRFNYQGHRYWADTPKLAKANLIRFDEEAKAKRKAEREGKPFHSQVEPFSFNVVGMRQGKVKPTSRARQDQVNAARRLRRAAGEKRKQYTLRQRIVGFA